CDVYAVRSSLLLLLLLGPPPRSTLFPYTTLFRSDGDAQRYGGEHGGRQTEADAPEAGAQVLPEAGVHVAFAEQLPATGEHGLRAGQEQGFDQPGAGHCPPQPEQAGYAQAADGQQAQFPARPGRVLFFGRLGVDMFVAAHARLPWRWAKTWARTCSRVSMKAGSDLIARALSPAA